MLLDRLAGPGFHGGTAPPLLPGLATIDRYVLRKAIAPLLAGTVVVLLALLLERLVRLLDLVVNKGSPISLIFKLLLNLTPHYIGIALPAAFFLAMLVAVHRLSTDSELDALQSFGLGLQRLLAPLTGVAILLMVLMIVVTGYVQPYSRYAYRALIYAITHATLQYGLEEGVFVHTVKGTTLMAQEISSDGRRLLKIFVNQDRGGGRSVTTTAVEGLLLSSDNDLRPTLRIYDGVQIMTDENGRTSVLTFDQFNWPLDLSSELSPFRWRGKDERELTLTELWRGIEAAKNGAEKAELRSEFEARIVRSLSLLFLPLLAIPLGQAGRRGRRVYGFVFGLVLLALYNNLLQFGEKLADDGVVSTAVGLWVPFALLAAFSLALFLWVARGPRRFPPDVLLARAEEAVLSAFGRRRKDPAP